MSRSVRMPIPACSESVTTAAPTRLADIWREAWRSVCAGPTVRTTLVIPSRTFMIAPSPPACELVTSMPSSIRALAPQGNTRRPHPSRAAALSRRAALARRQEVKHLAVQTAVGAHHAAAVRRGLAGQVGERAARLLHDDLQRGHVPERDLRFGGHVDRAFRDQHMGPEIAVRTGPPDRAGQAEKSAQPALALPAGQARERH